ncbi:MAG: SIR2 family protein [Myxococcota bacterium]
MAPGLEEALADGDLILCVGPGPSLAAGLPDLRALALAMLEHAAAADASFDVESLRPWIDDRAADVLEQLDHRLGAEFQREVERRLSDQGRAVPPILEALARLRPRLRAIYTTRLDRLIERALDGRWPSFSTARPGLAQRRNLVFKLRGTLEFNQTWVLTREAQEREFGAGAPRRRVFETAFGAHRMLFVGFEAPSQELRWLMDAMPTHTDGDGPSHLIVLPQVSAADREQLERRGLQVIDQDRLAAVMEEGGSDRGDTRPASVPEACPYPGLEAFSEARAGAFFGRHAEVSEATALLGTLGEVERRWLSIEGPSGVGKSSFALAGVLPALRKGFAEGTPARWNVAQFRPGATPLANLVSALDDAFGLEDTAAASAHLTHDPKALVELARGRLPPGEGLLVVVDQLEEIVTIAPEAEREPFGAALARALEARVIHLVTTTRSDLIPALQRGLPSLAGRLNDAAERYALPPISRAGLREAICEPAARLGVRVEPALVERLLLDAGERATKTIESDTRTADATLPLVAHVLRGLWTPEYVADGVLTLDEYTQLGGISGALSRGADAVLASLTPDERDRAQALLLALIRLQPDGTSTRRVLSLSEARELADDHVVTRLSGGLVTAGPNARLLIVRDNHGHHEVEIVHEALIRDWGTLRDWIVTQRDELLLGEDLARQADKWNARGRPLGQLPVGRDAIELLSVAPRGHDRELQTEFQGALRRAKTRRRKVAGGGFAAAALVAGAVAWSQYDNTPGKPTPSRPTTTRTTGSDTGATTGSVPGSGTAAHSGPGAGSDTSSTGGGDLETGRGTSGGLFVSNPDLGTDEVGPGTQLTQAQIDAGVAEVKSAVRVCGEKHRAQVGATVSFRFQIKAGTGEASVTLLSPVSPDSAVGRCSIAAASKATFAKNAAASTLIHAFDLRETAGMILPKIVSTTWRDHTGVLAVEWDRGQSPTATTAKVRDATGKELRAKKAPESHNYRIMLHLGTIETSHLTVELQFEEPEPKRVSPVATATIPVVVLDTPQKPTLARLDAGRRKGMQIRVTTPEVAGATEYVVRVREKGGDASTPELLQKGIDAGLWIGYFDASPFSPDKDIEAKIRVTSSVAHSDYSEWGGATR